MASTEEPSISGSRRAAILAFRAAGGLGVFLLLVNLLGFAIPLRAPEVDGYRDFADVETLEFSTAMRRLEDLERNDSDPRHFVTEATRIFHEGIAHISPQDVRDNGLDHYGMRVPVSENWVLFGLSFLKPDTYLDYEFCHYRRALERGTGRCGQQSLALVSYLSGNGIQTGFVALGRHAIATAEVADGKWYLLDPDYGGVIPFDIGEAEKDPESVLDFYWSKAARNNRIDAVYAPSNELRIGGPRARFARACPIEYVAYVLKWLVPLLLIACIPAARMLFRTRQSRG